MTIILTTEELERVTGYKTPKRQVQELHRQGFYLGLLRPGFLHQSDISRVPVSNPCQLLIRSDAPSEYDTGGRGVLTDGAVGSAGEAGGHTVELCAQPVSISPSVSSIGSLSFCTLFGSFDCIIFRPLHFDRVVKRLLIRAGKCRSVLRLDACNLLPIPPFLRLPASSKSQSPGNDCGSCVGVEAGYHRQPFHQVSIM